MFALKRPLAVDPNSQQETQHHTHHTAELLKFDEEQLYKDFECCISGNALDTWDCVMESDDFKETASRTRDNFEKAWKAWIYKHHRIKNIGDVMWRHFYRRAISKTEYILPEDFFRRFC